MGYKWVCQFVQSHADGQMAAQLNLVQTVEGPPNPDSDTPDKPTVEEHVVGSLNYSGPGVFTFVAGKSYSVSISEVA